MMSNPSQLEERKFVILSPLSIQTVGESVGIEHVPENIMHALAEDATYRLREIVSKSCRFMTMSHRKNLKGSDVDKAMYWSNVPSVKGVPDNLDFMQVGDVTCAVDSTLSLKDIVEKEVHQAAPKRIKLTSETLMDKKQKEDDLEIENSSVPEDECTSYYTALVECVLSDNNTLFEEMLKDISKNARIAPTLPYFTNFLAGTNLVSHDLGKLSWMLFTVRALLSNPYISLDHYIMPLLKSVMYCVTEPLAASINPLNDHWKLRDYGARLLAEILLRYSYVSTTLTQHVYSVVKQILADPTRPLCTHYGALAIMGSLGPEIIVDQLLPNLKQYVADVVEPVLCNFSIGNVHLKEDALKVEGVIKVCLQLLYAAQLRSPSREKTLNSFDAFVLASELFGDSLVWLESESTLQQAEAVTSGVSPHPGDLRLLGDSPHGSMRGLSVGDVFDCSSSRPFHKQIEIKFGNPVKARRRRYKPAETDFSDTADRLSAYVGNIKTRVLLPCQINCSLLSWL